MGQKVSTFKAERRLSHAESLFGKFEKGGEVSFLHNAVALDREALQLYPPGHPKRCDFLYQLGVYLWHRYGNIGEIMDVEEAISLGREALELSPRGHPDHAIFLNNLALYLGTRYNQLGGMADLNEAIVLALEALKLHPQGHPDRPSSLNNLAVNLSARYKQLGSMEDLNNSIDLAREVLVLCPYGHPHRAMSLNNLAVYLSSRHKQLGRMGDLKDAIVFAREALDLCPQGHPDRPVSLNNLAVRLSTRHKQLGGMADLNNAIILVEEALELCPRGHPDRAMYLNNLAARLSTRYEQLGEMADLDNAIILGREALETCPKDHPDRAVFLNNLAARLFTRYKRPEEMADLDDAVTLGREALNLCPQGHPDRAMFLSNLASWISSRYERLGGVADMDDAAVLQREALDLCPEGHPDRPYFLKKVAQQLRTRFMHTNQSSDRQKLFDLYSELANMPQTTVISSFHLTAVRSWVDAAEEFNHTTTLLAYETSLRLLVQHLATLPSLPEHLPILRRLTSSLAMDAFSACLRNGCPEKAVELLEQGRGVFWNQITRLRSPLDDVIASGLAGKILADEFTRLTSLIHDAINSQSHDQHDRVCHLNLDMDNVVTHIRNLPGLKRFLLPLLFSDLQRAAAFGPVIVVNASQYGCDALVIFNNRAPHHIPLKITRDRVRYLASEIQSLTSNARMTNVNRNLALVLRELWDEVVSPVVDVLKATQVPIGSRIWWCPTAEFSLLPLHAAGPIRPGQRNLSHFYVSSYTPTLSALIRSRRRNSLDSMIPNKCFVGIGQAQASGENELVSVGAELDVVAQRIQRFSTFTRIEGPESCIARVSKELTRNEWVHFACHGLPNRQHPFDSAFALHDGHFTIQHIMKCELERAEFAYLSACHTTVGDEESPDEVIHLASAMQFAGFRSVIGTMWAVDDKHTREITSVFYGNMLNELSHLDYTRAAFALNKTMDTVDIPFDQRILYVHIGA